MAPPPKKDKPLEEVKKQPETKPSKKAVEEEKDGAESKVPKVKPAKQGDQTKDFSKPPAGYPGLVGDLSQDPIGESLRDRLNFGGFATTVDEVTVKKNGCKLPKQIKLLVKGKDNIELIADQPKQEPAKDAKQTQRP